MNFIRERKGGYGRRGWGHYIHDCFLSALLSCFRSTGAKAAFFSGIIRETRKRPSGLSSRGRYARGDPGLLLFCVRVRFYVVFWGKLFIHLNSFSVRRREGVCLRVPRRRPPSQAPRHPLPSPARTRPPGTAKVILFFFLSFSLVKKKRGCSWKAAKAAFSVARGKGVFGGGLRLYPRKSFPVAPFPACTGKKTLVIFCTMRYSEKVAFKSRIFLRRTFTSRRIRINWNNVWLCSRTLPAKGRGDDDYYPRKKRGFSHRKDYAKSYF